MRLALSKSLLKNPGMENCAGPTARPILDQGIALVIGRSSRERTEGPTYPIDLSHRPIPFR